MISIIIPSYNQQEYLPQAIESALGQAYPVEVIVIDDGSTDSSLEVAKKYEKQSWGYSCKVVSQVNKGLASARNTGIMNATGDWILPLDADDMLLENCIEKILPVIRETEADIIAPSFKCFGLNSDPIVLMPNPTIADFKAGNRIGYCSAIRKSALLEVGGYNPKMVWGAEDYDLWFDLLKRGKKLVTIPEILWLYRTKPSSMWTETAKHKDEFMDQIKINHPELW